MTLKIETHRQGNVTMLRLIGRVRGEHLPSLGRLLTECDAAISLDLGQVTLVDAEVVTFLATWEKRCIPLLNAPNYITEWIAKERERNT